MVSYQTTDEPTIAPKRRSVALTINDSSRRWVNRNVPLSQENENAIFNFYAIDALGN